jgi:hypothetical protein
MRLKLSEGGTLVSMPVYFAPKVTGNYVSLIFPPCDNRGRWFYKRLFDTGVICGGIYQITVSLNGKYTYDNIIQFVRNFGKRGGYPVQSTGAYYQNIVYISKLLLSKSWNYYVNCDLLQLTMPFVIGLSVFSSIPFVGMFFSFPSPKVSKCIQYFGNMHRYSGQGSHPFFQNVLS